MGCGSSSRNNVNVIPLFRVGHNKELARVGLAHREYAFLANGVIGIRNRRCKWIAEYRARLLERDLVVYPILRFLIRVPGKLHCLHVSDCREV